MASTAGLFGKLELLHTVTEIVKREVVQPS
jgi:hypothetical protein